MSRQFFWCKKNEDGSVEMIEFDPKAPRREVNAPYVKRDEILDGVMSMTGSGKTHYTKSSLRAEYKRMGFEEVGNDIPSSTPLEDIHNYAGSLMAPKQTTRTDQYERELERDVATAIEQVRYNQAPLSEFDKERCKIINRNIANSELTIGGNDVRDGAKKL